MREPDAMERPSAASEETARVRPFGPVAAAFLAAGVGSLVLVLLTTIAEASESIKAKLEFSTPVGSLSGKTAIAVGVWAVSWAVLHLALRHSEPPAKTVYTVTAVLVGLGLLLTFPTFFQAFAPAE